MGIRARAVLLGLVFSGICVPVWADPFTIVSVSNFISVRAHAGSTTLGPSSTSNQPVLAETLLANNGQQTGSAAASLSTHTDEGDSLAFTGGAGTTHGNSAGVDAGGQAEASGAIVFDALEPLQFVLTGTALSAFSGDVGPSSWAVRLEAIDGSSTPFSFAGSRAELRDFLLDGLLNPGRYRYSVSALSVLTGFGTGGTGADLNVRLGLSAAGASATPEPASMLLLGTGLVGLVARRRVHARKAS